RQDRPEPTGRSIAGQRGSRPARKARPAQRPTKPRTSRDRKVTRQAVSPAELAGSSTHGPVPPASLSNPGQAPGVAEGQATSGEAGLYSKSDAVSAGNSVAAACIRAATSSGLATSPIRVNGPSRPHI